MPELDDTKPLPAEDAPPIAYSEEAPEQRLLILPPSALLKPVILTAVSLIAAVVGKDTIDVSWVDPALDLYTVAAPLVLGTWLHRKYKI